MANEVNDEHNRQVSRDLSEIIQGLTSAVYLSTPVDIVEFAANYFTELHRQRGCLSTSCGAVPERGQPAINIDEVPQPAETPMRSASLSIEGHYQGADQVNLHDSTGLLQLSTGDMATEPREGPLGIVNSRRQSVAAESFDPSTESPWEPTVIYPKTATQRHRLSSILKPIFLFQELDEDQMHKVVDAMQEMHITKTETIIQQGEDGEYFYVIESGSYDIFIDGNLVGSYDGHGFFGELALMYNTPRAATIVCTLDGILWAVDRTTFRHIVLKMAFLKRQLYDTWLSSVPLLRNLSQYERTNVADALVPRWVEHGEWIVREGERGSEMYFIEEGCVQITVKTATGDEAIVKTLGKNAYFGELALILKQPRQASAHSIGRTKLAALNVSSFERLMGPCSEVMLREASHYQAELISLLGKATCEIRHPALASLTGEWSSTGSGADTPL